MLQGMGENQYLDSKCSKHMTEDMTKLLTLTPRKSGHVTCDNNNRGRILGEGKIGKDLSTSIDIVLYVEYIKHKLLSIRQICDYHCLILFYAPLRTNQ